MGRFEDRIAENSKEGIDSLLSMITDLENQIEEKNKEISDLESERDQLIKENSELNYRIESLEK